MSSISLGSPRDTTSSLIEMNNQQMILVSQQAVEQQKILSATLLENAELKRTIAATEAENASLTVEIQNLRAKLEKFSFHSKQLRNDSVIAKSGQAVRTRENEKRVCSESELICQPKPISELKQSKTERPSNPELENLRKENRELKLRVAELESLHAKTSNTLLRVQKQTRFLAEEFDRRVSDFKMKTEAPLSNLQSHLLAIESRLTTTTRSQRRNHHSNANVYLEQLARGIRSIEELNIRYAGR